MKTKLKQSQRLRVLINSISIWTTVKHVRSGLGDRTSVNFAVQDALNMLESDRAMARKPLTRGATGPKRPMPNGIMWRSSQRGEMQVYDVQLDLI